MPTREASFIEKKWNLKRKVSMRERKTTPVEKGKRDLLPPLERKLPRIMSEMYRKSEKEKRMSEKSLTLEGKISLLLRMRE